MKNLILLLCTFLFVQCCKDDGLNYSMDNQTFINNASSNNSFILAAGILAQNRGINDQVKLFGEQIAVDHNAMALEMAALAQNKGWIVPAALHHLEQARLDTLSGLTGIAFSKKFTSIMVDSHQDAVQLFTRASDMEGVNDADLKSFANRQLPELKSYLQKAIDFKM